MACCCVSIRRMIKSIVITILVFGICITAYTQTVLPYRDSSLPVEARVKDILSRMKPEEKFWQLFMIPGAIENGGDEKYKNGIFGFQVSADSKNGDAAQQMLVYHSTEDALTLAKKINGSQKYFVEKTRLGIPIIAFDEVLHGLVRGGATSFPQAIALAATWDTALVYEVAHAIAVETKARGIRQVLSPVINIASDVRWGRVEETYGEDPFLVSEMGVAFISAFEKMNIVTTPKHFIANVGEGGRDSYPIHWNERLLDEIYFPPFEAAIKRGGARSVMTAYNSLDGIPCSANNWLLNKKLKGEWNFTGFVISDAGAVGGATVLHYTAKDYPVSGEQAINNGLDVVFQTAYDHYALFIPPFLDGRITSRKIDEAVSRILRAKFELGLFEHPYTDEGEAQRWVHNNSHKAIARKAARESMVLLKNDQQLLPFSKSIRSIAVIGVDATESRLGGYSGPGNGKINILDGMKERAGSGIKVSYAPGCGRQTDEWMPVPSEWLSTMVDGKNQNGLRGAYFNNISLDGNPVLTRTDNKVDFQWTISPPATGINGDFYSVRWTGQLHAPKSGHYKIGLDGNDGYRLYINKQLLIDNWKKRTYSTVLKDFFFEEKESYEIQVEFFEPVGNAHIRLVWNAEISDDSDEKIREAVDAAKQSDIAVIVAGIEEGEFRDRAMLNLPGKQEEMIRQVAATGKPTVVLLVGGSAITMAGWLNKVNSVLDVWYPGEEAGHAVADVLFGDYNPSGRLPITFPLSEAQLPLVYNHKPTGRGDDYNNLSGLPLFPFGFGLSYTRFDYSELVLEKNKMGAFDSTRVKCKVKNTGNTAGDEVVQLYIRDMLATVSRPVMELKGFQRIHLLPGEEKELVFNITPSMLAILDENLHSLVEPGDFRIMIGASSRDIRLKQTLSVVAH
jgi:beta-glucosidase